MHHLTLIAIFFSFILTSNAYAASLANISAWGFATHQNPHIACTIVSTAYSSQRVLLLVYGEANRSYNNQTDPEIFIGRPGNPATNPNAYLYQDDWSRDAAAAMVQAVGRTPNDNLDSGVFVSAPSGPMCVYAYEHSSNTGTGRINTQITYLGTLSSTGKSGNTDTNQRKFDKLSQTDVLDLFNNELPLPDTKMLPADTDIVTTSPDGME